MSVMYSNNTNIYSFCDFTRQFSLPCDHMLVCISPSFKPVILKILIVITYGAALIQCQLFFLT